MKTTKFLLTFILGMFIAINVGVGYAALVGCSSTLPVIGAIALTLIPKAAAGVLCEGVLTEVWTGELLKKFRVTGTFMDRIKARDELAENDVIHLVDVGADPEVLVNNTTYPIEVVTREDGDISISLDKFETTNTSVSDDELFALSYDKIGDVNQQHKDVLAEKTADKAAHALAPTTHSADHPIILTTGATNGETNARRTLRPQDIAKAKKALDDLKVPKMDRILVLNNEHIQDLINVDEKFNLQYKNIRTGEILSLYGFEIHEYPTCPVYKVTGGTLTKKAFGTAADPVNDQGASFFFYANRAFKATGTIKMYYSIASMDPQYRRSLIGYALRHIVLPKKNEGFGAIVSEIYTPGS